MIIRSQPLLDGKEPVFMPARVIGEDGVSILSASYLLEKNTGSGGGVTSFRDQVRKCT